MYVYIYICVYVYVYACVYVYLYVYVLCMCMCMSCYVTGESAFGDGLDSLTSFANVSMIATFRLFIIAHFKVEIVQ